MKLCKNSILFNEQVMITITHGNKVLTSARIAIHRVVVITCE